MIDRNIPTSMEGMERGMYHTSDRMEHNGDFRNGDSSPNRRSGSPISSPPSSPPRSSPARFPSRGSPTGFPSGPLPIPSSLPPSLPPGVFLPPNFNLQRPPSDYLNLQLSEGGYSRSPSYSMVSPNDPTANACKIVDFHGEKIASFNIHGKTMLCLPQAFELFLKNLVGGLHTVYTKCKRLDIHPLVCNVEQVRVLRGLGAIQPGVNRCKLIGDTDFEELMKDCNTSRPGRPPKRMTPITTFSSMPPHHEMFTSLPRTIPFPPPHSREMPFNPFMSLSGQQQAHQMAAHAQNLLRSQGMPGQGLMQEQMLEKYGNMLRHLHGLKNEEDIQRSPTLQGSPPHSPRSPALNLSYGQEDRLNLLRKEGLHLQMKGESESDPGEMSDTSVECERREIVKSRTDVDRQTGWADRQTDSWKEGEKTQSPASMIQLMSHIQDLVKTAINNAKDEKKEEKEGKEEGEERKEEEGDESLDELKKQVAEAQKLTEIYLRRFKKEKKLRRKVQDQLELQSIKKARLEEALSAVSYQTFLQLKEES
ncbi:dachshund homolog 1 isoform X2 [Eurytemora carolleeae]|uniref:dachshund homolog 1 isoform X2 n=1 Tax=Eurytemora carolleeae TaxID=1294199 RepID=UPI000C781231|nr:dachshund homolog 1 isoform X2 [Eurytemora carolleeae]|eukprot:XP_023349020.1 dachshund homolog 1-like isoform X2 [Eurytemora affinis]